MTEPRQQHFRTFALYNRWANDALYDAAAGLSPAQLAEDRGAFFKSLLGTLNHLVVTDRLWMGRLEATPIKGVRLDDILYPDFSQLRQARAAEDARIITNIFALDEADFDKALEFETTDGTKLGFPLGEVLAHIFNHQTHHRGQAHDLIGQLIGKDKTPVLDLMMYARSAGATDKP